LFEKINAAFISRVLAKEQTHLLDESLDDVGANGRTSCHDHQWLTAKEQFPEHLKMRQ